MQNSLKDVELNKLTISIYLKYQFNCKINKFTEIYFTTILTRK